MKRERSDGGSPRELPAIGGSTFRVSKVRPAYQQVADQIRDLIVEGQIAPGERLPPQPELTEMFGVSRGTVREALRMLSSQHLIVTSRGVSGGTFVARPEPGSVSQFLEASFRLLTDSQHLTVEHLLEARELLEVRAAALAARHRSDEHLDVLRSCLPARSDVSRAHRFEGNIQFHVTVLEASGNVILPVITRPIFSVLRTQFLRDSAPPEFWKQVGRDHVRILRAIEERDEERAVDEMQRHLNNLRPTYRKIYVPDRRQPAALGGEGEA